jgi:hypothetical protein
MISAAEQYQEDGFLSVDSLQQLLSYGVQYLAFLQDENGQLVINEESLQRVLAAKTEEMAVETALAYLKEIEVALTENDTAALERLTNATNISTQTTWAAVNAQLALLQTMGLTDEAYANVVNNINILRNMTYSVTSSMEQYGASLHSNYMSQQDAMEKLIELTKELIKHELDLQVEALEKQKEA